MPLPIETFFRAMHSLNAPCSEYPPHSIDLSESGSTADSSAVHLRKQSSGRISVPSPIVSVFSDAQPKNAALPIAQPGRTASVRPLPLNALLPISLRVAGSATVCSAVQFLNASEPIAVTVSGIVTSVSAEQFLKRASPIAVITFLLSVF